MAMRKARELRENKRPRVSLRDVEKAIQIDHSAIAKFETGDQGLSLANLQKYAAFLGCTVDELLEPATTDSRPKAAA